MTTDYSTHQVGMSMNGAQMLFADLAARTLLTSMENGTSEGMVILLNAIAKLQGEIDSLKNAGDYDVVKCIKLKTGEIYINGAPLYSQGEGAATFVPMFVGQQYFDTTNNALYVATKVTNSTGDWTSTK